MKKIILMMFLVVSSLLSQDTLVLPEIVVESYRANEKTPVTEYFVDKKSIDINNFSQEMPSFMSKLTNVTYYSDAGSYGGYAYFRMRGLDQTRINFTLNGIPLNEPEDQGVYFSNYFNFLSNIQDIQIQRGVGTSSNGTTSFAGSVNFKFLEPKKDYVNLDLLYGSYRSKIASLSGSYKNLYANISYSKNDGYRNNSGNEGYSGFLSYSKSFKNSYVKYIGLLAHSKNQMVYLPSSIDEIKINPRNNPLKEYEKDDFKYLLSSVQYGLNISNKWVGAVSGYYIGLKGRYNVQFYDTNGNPDILPYFNLTSNYIGSFINLNYHSKNIEIKNSIHGSFYKRNHFSDYAAEYWPGYYNSGEKSEIDIASKVIYSKNNFSLYGDIQGRLVNFKYKPDISYNLNDLSISWKFINSKLGITFNKFYFSLGYAEREPTRNDLFAGYDDLDNNNFLEIGDFNKVKPEKVYDLELGYKVKNNIFTLNANLFYMKFKDEIAPIGVLSYIGLPLRKNVESSYRTGVEIDGEYIFTKNLFLKLNLSIMESKIKEYKTDFDEKIYFNVSGLLTPNVISNSTLGYSDGKYFFSISGKYFSDSYMNNENTLKIPSAMIFDFNTAINITNNLKLMMFVNNIFDKLYYTSGQVVGDTPYYFVQANRNYQIKLTINY